MCNSRPCRDHNFVFLRKPTTSFQLCRLVTKSLLFFKMLEPMSWNDVFDFTQEMKFKASSSDCSNLGLRKAQTCCLLSPKTHSLSRSHPVWKTSCGNPSYGGTYNVWISCELEHMRALCWRSNIMCHVKWRNSGTVWSANTCPDLITRRKRTCVYLRQKRNYRSHINFWEMSKTSNNVLGHCTPVSLLSPWKCYFNIKIWAKCLWS